MHLYLRADADSTIGTGHIMRCIALAQAWQDRGGKAIFLSHCESDTLRQRIIDDGFDFITIDKPHPNPSDLVYTLDMLKQLKTNNSKLKTWVVLDGYHFTPEYQKAIRDEGIRLLVIDDMNHLPHYHADILLNQNIQVPELKYQCDKNTTLLMGTRYALLRREFLKYRDFNRQIPEQAKNILVTLGGADPDNVTLKVIEALKLLNESNIMAGIIIGPANPHQEALRKVITSTHFEAELLTNPPNMPELMAWADLAISAGGSTCWELAYMGAPFLAIILTENQRSIAFSLDIKKVAINCGDGNEITAEKISEILSAILCNREERSLMSLHGTQVNDGDGSMRVLASMDRLVT